MRNVDTGNAQDTGEMHTKESRFVRQLQEQQFRYVVCRGTALQSSQRERFVGTDFCCRIAKLVPAIPPSRSPTMTTSGLRVILKILRKVSSTQQWTYCAARRLVSFDFCHRKPTRIGLITVRAEIRILLSVRPHRQRQIINQSPTLLNRPASPSELPCNKHFVITPCTT